MYTYVYIYVYHSLIIKIEWKITLKILHKHFIYPLMKTFLHSKMIKIISHSENSQNYACYSA